MKIKIISGDFTVCQLPDYSLVDMNAEFCFVGKTDEELSLVCLTNDVPQNTIRREDGWRAFRIEGVLDFSLIGILSNISGLLAENKIGIFAISTFNTDYILVKAKDYQRSINVLKNAGHEIVE